MFPDAIQQYTIQKVQDKSQEHTKRIQLRKRFSKDVTSLIRQLASDTKSDRVLLFEYSNGTSNLMGLPFLYVAAAAEVLAPGISSVAHLYSKVNVSVVANFLLKLEDDGFCYIESLEDIKEEYPVLYNFLKPNNVESCFFYTIQGVEEVVGFIVCTSTNGRKLEKKTLLQKTPPIAQKISSMLNFDELDKIAKGKKKRI